MKRELKGERFYRLMVIKLDKEKYPNSRENSWICLCDCGSYTKVRTSMLTGGRTRSCGCLARDKSLEKLKQIDNKTHNMTGTKEYKCWANIKARCRNKDDARYKSYGAKGIDIQDSWFDSFENFIDHVGICPTGSCRYSLDRINNKKGYEEGNVRWVPENLQTRNLTKKITNKSGKTGVYMDKKVDKNTGKEYRYYKAIWYELDGKQMQVGYSFKKYGEELARFLAEETRDLAIEYLNNNGAGYTERHGLSLEEISS